MQNQCTAAWSGQGSIPTAQCFCVEQADRMLASLQINLRSASSSTNREKSNASISVWTPAMSQCAQHCKLQMLLQAKCECLSPHYMVSHLVVLQKELLESRLPQSDATLPTVDLLQPLTLMRRRYSLLLRYLQQTLHHILWK